MVNRFQEGWQLPMWMLIALVIEGMALVGVLGVLATKRTRSAFLAGFNTMLPVTAIYVWYSGAVSAREIVVLAFVAAYLLRMNWILAAWRDQTAVSKIDARTPPPQKYFLPFLLANTVGWGYCLPFYFAARRTDPLGWIDALALGIYVVGTAVHFGSDYQKRRFKRRPDAVGRILDTGFWSGCRHPNYFGDFLIYISFAVIGASTWGWVSPLLNLLQYMFDAIPKSERWAAERYGPAWEAYKAKTKAFVPYLI